MEEINILEFLNYIKKHFVFFGLIAIFTVLVGLFYFMVVKRPMYTSDVSLTLTGASGQSKITTNDITLNTKMIPTYQEVITSRKVLEQVMNNLKIDKNIKSLGKNIKISAATDSLILSIAVSDTNRITARDIANEVAGIFGEEIKSLYNIQSVTILDKAVASDSPSNMSYVKSILLSVACGIVLALAFSFVIFFFDNTIKSVEQVDTKIGFVILGSVPDYNVVNKNSKKGGKNR